MYDYRALLSVIVSLVVLGLLLFCILYFHVKHFVIVPKTWPWLVLSVTVFVLDIVHNYNVDLMRFVFVYDDERSTVHV